MPTRGQQRPACFAASTLLEALTLPPTLRAEFFSYYFNEQVTQSVLAKYL